MGYSRLAAHTVKGVTELQHVGKADGLMGVQGLHEGRRVGEVWSEAHTELGSVVLAA